MSDNEKCHPYPHVHPSSWASGSSSEQNAKDAWEAKWGSHPDACFARLEPVMIHPAQLGAYRAELRAHLDKEGAHRLMSIAPHHLNALLEEAARVQGLVARVAALEYDLGAEERRADDEERRADTAESERDLLRETGAKNTRGAE